MNAIRSSSGSSNLEPVPAPFTASTSQPLRQSRNVFPSPPNAVRDKAFKTTKAGCRGCVHHHFHYRLDNWAKVGTEGENTQARRERRPTESESPLSHIREASRWLLSSRYTKGQATLPQKPPSGHSPYSGLGDREEPSNRTHTEDRSHKRPGEGKIPEEDTNARRMSQATAEREPAKKFCNPYAHGSRTKSPKRKRRSKSHSAEPKWKWMHPYIRPSW